MKLLSKLMVALMLVSILPSSFAPPAVYADEGEGLTLVQTVTPEAVAPEDVVTVNLSYSTASTVDNFYNVQIQYILPPGAVFNETVRSGHVLDESYNAATRTVTFVLGDKSKDAADPERHLFPAGVSGDVQVKFHFPLPSVYPDGVDIPLNPGVLSWNLNASDGEVQTADSNSEMISYELPASWSIDKKGPESAVISNNPSQTQLQLSYDIVLSGGNIDLRDVQIMDTLPEDATLVSSDIGEIGGTYTIAGNEVTFAIPALDAGSTTSTTSASFEVKLAFLIDRGLGEGVVSGDSRTNTVTVKGYPVHIDEDGDFVKWAEEEVFYKNSDSVTTEFSQSDNAWGVYTTGPNQVELSINPLVTEVEVEYSLGIDGGEVDMEDVALSYILPADAEVVDSDGGTYDEGTHTIAWAIGNLAGGSSVEKNITVKYPIVRTPSGEGPGVSNGDSRTNTVSAFGRRAGGSADNIITSPGEAEVTTIFVGSTAYWSVTKSGPGSIVLPHEGLAYVDVIYTLALQSTGQGNTPLRNVTLTDQLPAENTTYLSATVPPTTNDGSTLTWEFEEVSPSAPPSVQVTVRYDVDRGSGSGVKPGDLLTNGATVTAFLPDSSGAASTEPYDFGTRGSSNATTHFVEAAFPNPRLSINIYDFNKQSQDKNFDIGDEVVYLIDFNNNQNDHNEKLYQAVLTDESLPTQIDYTEISLGRSSASVGYTFEYQTNLNSWRTFGGPYSTGTSTAADIMISDLGLAEGEYLTGIRINYLDEIPAGFQLAEKIQLKGTVNSTAPHDSSVGNSAKLDYQHRIFEDMSAVKTLTDSVSFKVLLDTAWISQLKKTKLTESASYQHYTDTNISFKLEATNHNRLATDDFYNPVLVDVVPAGFEYLGNVVWSSSLGGSGLPTPPHFQQYDNYPQQGQTTLLWSWDAGAVLKKGETITLQYDMKIKSYAGVGTHTNQFFMYGTGDYKVSNGINIITDVRDLDKDTDSAESLLEGQHATITVRETSAINSYKWVRGELDDEEGANDGFHRYPQVGVTAPGGAADYKLEVFNAGNTYLKDIELVDILPRIGDTAVLSSVPRDSEWRPYLIQALVQGELLSIVKDIYGNTTAVDLEIYYSTATDPIRKGQNNQTIGTQQPNWTVTPPQDITSVRSLRFVVKNFAEDPKGMKPGSKVQIDWRMRAPIGTPVEAVAWNSVSMTGTTISYDNSQRTLLPAEPNKVGIQVQSNPLGEIGNFVWFDKNGDGLQNDGYDQQMAGINGIKAHLYQYHEDGDEWTIVDSTLTGDDQFGNPGYYLFPNLEDGRYYVAFELPAFYSATVRNSGNDGALDSDGYAEAGSIRTAEVTVDVDVPDLKINHNLDLGLIAAGSEVPALTLSKEAIGYERDGHFHGFSGSQIPVNVGDTLTYRITLTNTGNTPLHNIRLEDAMEYSGFQFTQAAYNGASEFTDLSLDPNIQFSGATGNVLKLLELPAGASYRLEGEYTVRAEDVDGTALENVIQVWANELNDQGDPENPPYSEAEEQVDIAAMGLTKTAYQVKPTGQSQFLNIENLATLGVEPGDTIKYKITVFNTGSADLQNVLVTDDKLGFSQTVNLPAGAELELDVDYVVTEGDRPQVINTAEAEHAYIGYTVEDDSTVNFKGLAVIKEVTAVNGAAPPVKEGKFYANPGDVIEYTITLLNTDQTPLHDVMITKDLLTTGRNTGEPDLLLEDILVAEELGPDQQVTYTLNYTVQAEDISTTGGTLMIHNQVFAKSQGTFEKDAYADVEIADLTVSKTANKDIFRRSGDLITYTIQVTNRGSIALSNVLVQDPMLGINQTLETLLPDETRTLTGSYFSTSDDVRNRQIVNIVAVSADEVSDPKTAAVTLTYRRPSDPTVPPVEPPVTPPDNPPGNPEEPQPPIPTETETTPEDTPTGGQVDVPEGSVPGIGEEPENGQVTVDEDGNWTYTPDPGFTGQDDFSITITDGDGNQQEIFIEINVEEIPAGAPELPKTGQTSDIWFYFAGLALVLIGFKLRKKTI